MKYNETIEKQYQAQKMKREIRTLNEYLKKIDATKLKIELKKQSLQRKLRGLGERAFYLGNK